MTTSTEAATRTEPYRAAIRALGLLPDADWTVEISGRRRRVALRVRAGGQVVLLLPPGAEPLRVAQFVKEQRAWLAAQVSRQRDAAPTAAGRQLVDGEVLQVFGRPYRLQFDAGRSVRAVPPAGVSEPGMLLLPRGAAGDAELLIDWYTSQGLQWVHANAPRWERQLLSAAAPTYVVRDLGVSRLGLYQPRTHRVALHWPLFQLPPRLVDCALGHEIVHASRPVGKPHGADFRRRFDLVLPGNRALEREVRQAAKTVWRGELRS